MRRDEAPAVQGYDQGRWDLGELLPRPVEPAVSQRLARLERAVAALEARRGELDPGMDPRAFLDILRQYEASVEEMTVLGAYASLSFAADTQSPEVLTYKNRVENALTALGNRILFLTLWWKGLEDEQARALLPAAEEHADFRHFLADVRRLKPFTLEERSEQIINLKDANGIDAVLTLYSMLTNRLEFTWEVDGQRLSLTRDELMGHAFSPSTERRAAAYQELLRVYERESVVLSQIYANRVRDWHAENVELRGFASPIAVRNAANDIPDAAVETLLEVVREHAGLFRRYFRLKARWLGMDRLRRYDLYAPLGAAEGRVPYEEAVRSVLDTFYEFHPTFAARAERLFAENHIDSEIRRGKKGGAFCATVLPRQAPWLLVNHTGQVRDVATLAHELGHAVHSLLASGHSVLTQHPSLPLAETASVFAEMLVTDRLLREERSPEVRRELLAAAVDEAYATVMRQAFFVRFEQAAHAAVLAGKSPEELDALYLETLAEQFGDSVEVTPDFRREWLGIPHLFHTPFYCYAYSFGQLLVLALYRRYREEGAAFVPGYLKLLAYGGSARPQEILAEAGVDMTDRAFWRGGFAVVADLIAELESLGPARPPAGP